MSRPERRASGRWRIRLAIFAALVTVAGLGVAATSEPALAGSSTAPGTWTQVDDGATMPAGAGATMAYDGDSKQLVLVAGGNTYTWNAPSWTRVSDPGLSVPAGSSMAYDGDSKQLVLVAGGTTYTWNAGEDTWDQVSNTGPGYRVGATLGYYPGQGLILFGGYPGGNCASSLGDMWTWDGTSWTQNHPSALPDARDSAAMAYDPDTHELVLFGGAQSYPCSGHFLADVWTYDGTTWTDTNTNTAVSTGYGAAMAYDAATTQLLLFGGLTYLRTPLRDSDLPSDSWAWVDGAWQQLSPAQSPGPRYGAAMAYDAASGQVVLYGGQGSDTHGGWADTWTWAPDSSATAPGITTQPGDQDVVAGDTATFTAAATGTPTPSVRWRVSTDGGTTFTDLDDGTGVSGATSATLTLTGTTPSQSGNQYQAVFTNVMGTANSDAVTLTVAAPGGDAPYVTGQPQPTDGTVNPVTAGNDVRFEAAAEGNPAPTVEWRLSADNWKTSVPANGSVQTTTIGTTTTQTTLTLTGTTPGESGYQYQAVFTNSAGSATSSPVTLIVSPAPTAPVVRDQPSDVAVDVGGHGATQPRFTATVEGDAWPVPTVQWEVSTDGGTHFTPIPGATGTPQPFGDVNDPKGYYAATLSLQGPPSSESGNQYRAVFTNPSGTATSAAATLLVAAAAPTITTQPADQTVTEGDPASFTAAAGGNPVPSVQWQQSTDGTTWNDVGGATGTTLTISNTTTAQSGNQYRAVFTNSQGSATSTAATLTVLAKTAPQIQTPPTDVAVVETESATFTATATGNPTPTVQWQESTDHGGTWIDVSGATDPTLTVSNTTTAQSDNQYRAVFTNSQGSATSTAATLTVHAGTAPSITTQPIDQTLITGQDATFTAAADGSPTPTVQWQQSIDGGATFTDLPGETATTLTITAVWWADSGSQYRAVFTNGLGTATTAAATLAVAAGPGAPAVTQNPRDVTVTEGRTATFTAAATGDPTPTVQWQVLTGGVGDWTDVPGATRDTLTIADTTLAQSGTKYQALFHNTNGDGQSLLATLTVNPASAPTITTQPTDQTVTAGQDATFTAAASGDPAPTVQWQVSTGGSTWTDLSGATEATLTLDHTTAGQDGNRYRAVFTNSAGSTSSDPAVLTVHTAPTVGTQPSDQTVIEGQGATFTAIAGGNPAPTVQWQQSTDGSTWADIPGAVGTTLTLTAVTFAQNGYRYRAAFTNSVGSTNSDPAVLTVHTAPSVGTQPGDQTVTAGQDATFTAAASGSPAPTVQWQVSTGGGAFADLGGATSTTLTLRNTSVGQSGRRYRAVFTNSAGTATSAAATLTVDQPTDGSPYVTTQPADQVVTAGDTATFTAAAGGDPAPTVQWQQSTDRTTWTDLQGATDTTLTLTGTTTAQNGYQYRAVFTNGHGTATSGAAALTVQAPPPPSPSVTVTSPGNQKTVVGAAVSLQITATNATGLTAAGLPAGLTMSGTGSISGRPTLTGTWSVTVTATGAGGPVSTTFTWTVTESTTVRRDATELVASGSTTITYGQRRWLAVRVRDTTTGTTVGDARVALQYRLPGAGGWTPYRQVRADSAGLARYLVHPGRNVRYRWQYPGDPAHQAATSRATAVRVAQAVAVATTAHRIGPHQTVTLWGEVAPAADGRQVWVYSYRHGRWVTTRFHATVRRQLMPDGAIVTGYLVRVTLNRAGPYLLRARRSATGRNALGWSPTVHVTVRRPS